MSAYPSLIELSALDGTNGFGVDGAAAGDFSGGSVASAGDVNGDGLADLIVGAHAANGYTLREWVKKVEVDNGTRIKALETEIEWQITRLDEFAERAERYISAPGIGPATPFTLIAHMPELGRLSPKTAASLAGLAPFNDDSGNHHGRRHIRGGRPRIRRALYMAALGAIRAARRFRHLYHRVATASGSKKAAIIAVATKLITILNAMQRDKTRFA